MMGSSSPFHFGKKPAKSFVIVGVTVVNVNAASADVALKLNRTIVIEGDRITALRPTTSADLEQLTDHASPARHDAGVRETIDGRNLFAIPGLIDTHVHLDWNHDEASELKLLLANGVTAILEAGNPSEKVFQLRRQSLSRDFPGPRMEVCGPIITSTPAAWPGMTVVSTPRQAKQAVRARAMAGAKFVKIYAQLPGDLSQVVIDAAHRRGMRVIGHLGRTNASEATSMGMDIITHLSGVADSALRDPEIARARHAQGFSQGWQATNAAWQQAVPENLSDLIRRMVANRVALSPTLWFQEIFATLGEETEEKRMTVQHAHAPPAILKSWQHFTMDIGDPEIYRSAWPLQKAFVKSFYKAGGLLIAGTDTPNQFVAPGLSLHQEIELFVETGIPPLEALKSATVYASRALGHEEDFGSIEVGTRADLLLIEGDPLVDLKNIRKIGAIFRSGNLYHLEQLLDGSPPSPSSGFNSGDPSRF